MGKIKTSVKHRSSSKTISSKRATEKKTDFEPFSPTEQLADEKFTAQVVWECLRENDTQGVLDAIGLFLEAKNKLALSRDSGLSRSTIYDALKAGGNPTLRTLAQLVHSAY